MCITLYIYIICISAGPSIEGPPGCEEFDNRPASSAYTFDYSRASSVYAFL